MSETSLYHNTRPKPDDLLVEIADYVHHYEVTSELALKTAYLALLDSLACAFQALRVPACRQLLGPIVPGTVVPGGARVPGTDYVLDPILAAFNIGTCIRWLDYNDTWLAAEWGHPSDNLGGILAISDYMSRPLWQPQNPQNPQHSSQQQPQKKYTGITLKDILIYMIKAYEIQGILALENAFNRVGLDHVLLVKVATTAVVAKTLGLSRDQTIDALSQAWVDGGSLRTYRQAPNTGARKSWAAGDATSRGVHLAWMVKLGEQGYPSVLTAKHWGFCDVLYKNHEVKLARPLNSYVMENILFKVSFPAEFHAQTAVECAILLYPEVKERLAEIEKIEVFTQEPGMRIINKEGPLYNYADRDHCLQYMIAIGLVFGELKAQHYSDETAKDPRIDPLRAKMIVQEDRSFSEDYLDSEKRAIPNALQIFFKDGSKTDKIVRHYPLGHKKRREEAEPYLKTKYFKAVQDHFKGKQVEILQDYWGDYKKWSGVSVAQWMDSWVV
jgi:2-methylcitrate dehydratase